MGPGGARRGPASEDRPILLSIGYSACHWCHVMEHESFEDPETRGLHERALRQHQGRPRGAARPRRDLHGGGAGDDRPRRLADDRLPRPRRGALLRRHLLPARRAPRDAELPHGDGSGGRRLSRRKRDEMREPGAAASRARLGAIGALEPAAERARPRRLLDASGRGGCERPFDLEHGGFGGAPKFPPVLGAGAAARPRRRPRLVEKTLDAMAAGGIYDQLGGGFAPLLGRRRAGSSPTSRRCSTTTPCSPAPTCTAGRRSGTSATGAVVRGDARLGAARDARAGGRLLLGARRRLRGRGGPLLRLDAGADPRGARATRRRGRSCDFYGVTERGNFEGAQHPAPAPGGATAREPDGPRRRARPCTRSARQRVWPGLDDKRLDRPGTP